MVTIPHHTGGQRRPWTALPAPVVEEIERLLGARVTGATDQPGGFSEGVAARVRLADGTHAFVKAAQTARAPAAAAFHRREAPISERLAGLAPVPRLLGAYDDGDWVALAFEEIDGRLPAQPWRRDELAGAEAGAESPYEGDTLLHGDLYPFNVLICPDRVVVVDWPHAWAGAPYADVVTLLSSARLSGVDPQPLADAHPLTRHLAAAQIDDLLVLHAGFLLRLAVTAGPGADRALLKMATALGRASLDWLRERW